MQVEVLPLYHLFPEPILPLSFALVGLQFCFVVLECRIFLAMILVDQHDPLHESFFFILWSNWNIIAAGYLKMSYPFLPKCRFTSVSVEKWALLGQKNSKGPPEFFGPL